MSQKIEWIRFEDQKLSIAIDQNTKLMIRDTNLVLDSATQSWTGHKSGTSNV